MSEHSGNKGHLELDREVIRCKVCGLVQYRTRTGNCRRCLRLLPARVEFMVPPPAPQELPGDDRQLFEAWPNRETVENIGQRIRQLRESRGMTQSQLQAHSRVSRSYLSRIESGQMTPSLGTLEKISEALGVGLNRFFIPESNGEILMEDPFIQGLRPFLRQLDWTQWQSILKRLQAISDHVGGSNGLASYQGNGNGHLAGRSGHFAGQNGHLAVSANGNGNGNGHVRPVSEKLTQMPKRSGSSAPLAHR